MTNKQKNKDFILGRTEAQTLLTTLYLRILLGSVPWKYEFRIRDLYGRAAAEV